MPDITIIKEFVSDWFGAVFAASKEASAAKNQELLFMRASEIMVNNGWSKNTLSIDISQILSFKSILETTLIFYRISPDQLFSGGRQKEYTWPKITIAYLARELLKMSYQGIGEKLGGKNHSTIMYYMEQVPKLILDYDFAHRLNRINQELMKYPNYPDEVSLGGNKEEKKNTCHRGTETQSREKKKKESPWPKKKRRKIKRK